MCACNPNIRTPYCSKCTFHAPAMAGSSIKEAMEKAQHDKYAKEIKELVELTGSLYEPTDMALMDEAAELRNEINKLELKLEVQRLKEKRDNLRKQLNYKG